MEQGKSSQEKELTFSVESWGWSSSMEPTLQVKVPSQEIPPDLSDSPQEGRIIYFTLHRGRGKTKGDLFVERVPIWNNNEDWDYPDKEMELTGIWQAKFKPPLPDKVRWSILEPFGADGKITKRTMTLRRLA